MSHSPFPPCPPIPKATGPVELILPPTEDRPHKYFTLDNGLEVVVVSDEKADKAAASMDVGVGHFSDPADLPGCAHFCEHLLFMGTKSYPSENAYQQYLTAHNGHSNAWTAMTSTNYFFDVSPDALEGALNMFSGFFIEPLFNEDCTEREIKAVDSEHKKNIQNDVWRFFQLEKSLSRPGHPYSKFGTGNYETLWSKPKEAGRDPRKQLMEWWEKEYCARRMKLAVVGKEPIEVLEKWVKEKFQKVPIRTEGKSETGPEGVRLTFEESPFGEEQVGGFTFAKPVRDMRGLEIIFPFPDLDHLYKSRPTHFLAHFLGHEGRGSILSYLKKQGWVNSLSAGNHHDAAGFSLFKISVDLTPEGLAHHKDVALVIFKYISLLRSKPPSEEAFNEIKAIADISFKFAERGKTSSYCASLSGFMQSPVPREKIVSAKWLVEEYKQDELEAALQLLDPRRSTIGITCKELPKDVLESKGDFDQKEAIYGTEYKRVKYDEEFLKEVRKVLSELQLPGPNLFIPEKLDVEKFDVKEPANRPVLLKDTPSSRLWYKRDDRFWQPRANLDILLHSPILQTTPRNAVLSRLFCDLFSDSITEDVYDADLAELSFSLWNEHRWIGISAGGFSDKLAVLTETMLKKFKEFKVDEGRFREIVEATRMEWKNFALADPYGIALFWDAYVTRETAWTQEERLKELEFVTLSDVEAFGKEVLSRLFIETLVHGNTSPEGAKEMQEMVEQVLSPRPLSASEIKSPRSLLTPPSSEHIWSLDLPNKAEVNSAVVYHLHVGEPTDVKLRNTLSLFSQIASEPAFDYLRTKQQLGYIVFSHASSSAGSMGYSIIVQSEKPTELVENKIEYLLDTFLKETIDKMTDEEFEKHRMSLIQKKEEKPKNLSEESKRFWGRVKDRYYEFNKRENDVEALKTITKSDVLSLYEQYITTKSSQRSKLSVHLKSQYKGIKFDPSSAGPLVENFMKAGITVDQSSIATLLATNPSLDTVKQFAVGVIDSATNLDEETKKGLKSVVENLKGSEEKGVEGQEEGVRESNVYIGDILEFKAGLIPSKAATPVEPIKLSAAKL
uniref:Insulysin n=1 Tax=Kwoniella bestiolae CBS 10118 TaxID=1296100 RepID=A0A1B9FUC9_9TREE|nr:insulysin [Kwoniella bestiolae CBS 10118]OCF22367.1 insulysin [Kwoniella bestiolae CBS 10118]